MRSAGVAALGPSALPPDAEVISDSDSSTPSEVHEDGGVFDGEEQLWEPPHGNVDAQPDELPDEPQADSGAPVEIRDLGSQGRDDDDERDDDDDGAGVVPPAIRRRVSWGTRATVGTPASELPQRTNPRRARTTNTE